MAREWRAKLRGALCALRKVPLLWGTGLTNIGLGNRLFL